MVSFRTLLVLAAHNTCLNLKTLKDYLCNTRSLSEFLQRYFKDHWWKFQQQSPNSNLSKKNSYSAILAPKKLAPAGAKNEWCKKLTTAIDLILNLALWKFNPIISQSLGQNATFITVNYHFDPQFFWKHFFGTGLLSYTLK